MESSSKYIYTPEAIISLNKKQCSLPRDVMQQLKGFHLIKGDPGPKRTPTKINSKEQSFNNSPSKGLKEKINNNSKNISAQSPSKENKPALAKPDLSKKKSPNSSTSSPITPQVNKEDVKPTAEKISTSVVSTLNSQPTATQRVPFSAIPKSTTIKPSTSSVPVINKQQGISGTNKVVNNNNKENMVNTQSKPPLSSSGKSLLAPQTTIKVKPQIPSSGSAKPSLITQRPQALKVNAPDLKPTSQAFKPSSPPSDSVLLGIQKEVNIPPLDLTHSDEPSLVPTTKKRNAENDPRRLEQRQKQIEYGYKTIGYQNYISKVPKNGRGPKDPVTPRKNQKCSKRSWDGQIRKWRRELHQWDPETQEEKNHFIALIKETYGEEPSEPGEGGPNDNLAMGSLSEEEQLPFLEHAQSSLTYVNYNAVESV